MGEPNAERAPTVKPSEYRLDSWKEIAAYLNRNVTTVQRWEKREGMPVHRHLHDRAGSVYALAPELHAWLESRRPRVDESSNKSVESSARDATRLIVLPFRILRHHESSDFLAVALPDAITISLCAIDSVITRSTLMASRLADSSELDLKRIAKEAQVDAIVTGAVSSDGQDIRVSSQLVEAVTGTAIWTNTSIISAKDAFALQDQLVDRIVQSLMLPLTARERGLLKHDVPANAAAYECYLRANHLSVTHPNQDVILARDLYLQCLEADPRYAPAWARLGRTYRYIGKYLGGEAEYLTRAEEAFQKSFSLNPDLGLAHNFYTSLEADLGRALSAMERLLRRAQAHRNDPDLFVGLVQACRYCGLYDASVAAHERARLLEPSVRTSVSYTFRYLNMQAALDHSDSEHEYATHLVWAPPGREQEALVRIRAREQITPPGRLAGTFLRMCRTYLEDHRAATLEALEQCLRIEFRDPEALFGLGTFFAKLNEPSRSLEVVGEALAQGYVCHHMLLHHPWFGSLRSHQKFPELAHRAAEQSFHARQVFLDNGGKRLLGFAATPLTPPRSIT